MNAHERLEMRLKVLDLRMDVTGVHVDEERIALIASGEDPAAAEAQHLSGCDECLELLVALGAGLEKLVTDGSAASSLLAPPHPAPRRRPRPMLVIGALLVATAAAAAGGMWLAGPRAPSEAVVAVAEPPTRSALPAAPAVTAPVAVEVAATDPLAPATQTEPQTALQPSSSRVVPPDAVLAPPVAATAPAAQAPDTSLRARTQHRLDRQFINGAPRGVGYLRLNSKPASTVLIDGRPFGTTPLLDEQLSEGPHDVELRYESPLAAEPVQRFRIVIERDRVWSAIRRNLRATPE